MNAKKKYLIERINIVTICITLFLVLDVINFIIDKNVGLELDNGISVYGKAFVEIIAIIYILYSRKFYLDLLGIAVLMLLPVIGYILTVGVSQVQYNDIYIILRESNKYIFSMLLFLYFSLLKIQWRFVFSLIEIIFLMCATIVLIALVFNLDYFYTYGYGRFGYKPPFAAQNEITFFWMIGITYFGYKYVNKRQNRTLLKLLLIITAAISLGAKAILLFVICFFLYLIFFHLRISILKKILFLTIIITAIVSYVYISNSYYFFLDLYKDHGLLYVITSKRNVLIEERMLPLVNDWSGMNYLLGGLFSNIPLVEMDLIDVLLFYGIIGTLLYVLLLKRTIFNFKINCTICIFFVIQFVLIGGLAGHIFPSGLNAIYLAILCLLLQKQNNCFYLGN